MYETLLHVKTGGWLFDSSDHI